MKPLLVFLLSIIATSIQAQDHYFTRNGTASFYSSTPVEDIKAINEGVVCVLDMTQGNVEISMLNRSFQFKKALMQEHFNENYIESHKYPKSKFNGEVVNIGKVDLTSPDAQEVTVKGDLTIHGETRSVEVPGTVSSKEGKLMAHTRFMVAPEDYGIKIPGMVRENIAKEIEVNIDLVLEPLKK